MRKIIVYSFALLISLYQPAQAQQKPITIPFELTDYNYMSVKAILNHKDTLQLLFHTAASGLMLIEESTKKLSGIQYNRVDTVKSWGSNSNTSRYSASNTLQIGSLTWEHLEFWEDKNSAQGTDGKFGPDLFKDKAIEINFDKKLIVLHATLPGKIKKYTKLAATYKRDMLFLEAQCNTGKQTITNSFLLHSGYSGCLLLDDQFVASNKLGEQLTLTSTQKMTDAMGNVLKVQKAILPQFTLGKTTFTNTPVGFFEGAMGRQKMSVLGCDVLKRFNIIIDATRTAVYLHPNKLQKLPYTT